MGYVYIFSCTHTLGRRLHIQRSFRIESIPFTELLLTLIEVAILLLELGAWLRPILTSLLVPLRTVVEFVTSLVVIIATLKDVAFVAPDKGWDLVPLLIKVLVIEI